MRTQALAILLAIACFEPGRADTVPPVSATSRTLVIHEPPSEPSHQAALSRLQAEGTFLRSVEFFNAFRLPRPIAFVTQSCSGRGGAWYYEGKVTICYEYVQSLAENAASPQRPDWVSEDAAFKGGIADVVLHEGAHALFEFFRVPLMGREEDAADMMSTFAVLNLFGAEAPALIGGIAYSYLVDARARNFSDLSTLQPGLPPSRAYGGAHSTPLQRLFSVVCHASGHDAGAYQSLVAMSELPRWRSAGCEDEYKQIQHAFDTLLAPHIDLPRAREVFPGSSLLAEGRKR